MKRLFIVMFMLVAATAFAQTADMQKRGLKESDFPKIHKIADNVYIYEMIRAPINGEQFTTNNLVVVTTEGVLVADGQGSVADTTQLVAEIKKLTNQPIKYVVIASEHGDHTGGNSVFPAGVTFISHPVAKANFERQASAPPRGGAAAPAPPVIVPTEVVADKKVMKLGNTEIQILNLGRSHTGSDLTVYLPREKVLFLSETYFHNLFPAGRTGYVGEWIEAIKKAQAMDAQYFVPGHGFIDDAAKLKADLVESRKALESVMAEAKRLHKPGVKPEDAFKEANFGPYSTWGAYAAQGQPTFARAWAELDGTLK